MSRSASLVVLARTVGLAERSAPERTSGGPSDAALVVAARAREAWAFEVLYRRHVAFAHGLARRLLGRDDSVDDVLQDTFITAFEQLERLEQPASFRSWIGGMIVRKVSKLFRRRRLLSRLGLIRKEGDPDVDAILSRAAPVEAKAELSRIYQHVKDLPADLRVALLLRRIEGATLEEIAEWTGASLATVKRRIAKAEAAIDDFISDVDDEPSPESGVR
jgi:RNA polymerase sigma-70 factor (ECF subfamily)